MSRGSTDSGVLAGAATRASAVDVETSGDHGPPATLVPEWLSNVAALGWRVLAVAAVVAAAAYVVLLLWTVTASIAVAIIVAAVLAPYVLRLRARGKSRNAAAAIVWTTAILVIGGALLFLALAFLPYLGELAARLDEGQAAVEAQLADLGIPPEVADAIRSAVQLVRDAAGTTGEAIVAAAAEFVTIAILATFLLYFFLRDGDKAWVWAFQSAPTEKRDLITTAGDDALARVGGYLRGTTALSGLVAITDYVFMLLLGVPMALPLGVLAFLFGYIPYFGGIISTALILLVTLGALGSGPFVVMLVLMAIRGALISYVVRPKVYGRTVSIHPAVVLIVLPAGYQLAGAVGLFAAVPVTAVVIAVARAVISVVEPRPRPALPSLVPAWLDRMAQFGWRMLVLIGLGALLVAILVTVPLVVLPVLIALILTATLEPSVAWLQARGHTRGRATAIALGGGTLLVTAALALAVAALVQEVPELTSTVTTGASSADESAGGYLGLLSDAIASGAAQTGKAILELADQLAAVVTVTILGILLTFYFLRDGNRLWEGVTPHLKREAEPQVRAVGERAFDVLGGYMTGTGAVSFVGAASQWVIMVLLGLPLAFPVFVLSFFLGYIPYIGSLISTGIAFLIAVAVGDPIDVLIMGIWTIVFNLVVGNVVSPLVYERTVHIHPAIVLVAIPAGSAIAGPIGMFLAVPVVGIVSATWRTVMALTSDPGSRAWPGQAAPDAVIAGAPESSSATLSA